MARQFNMSTVFRSVNRTLLREFFDFFGAEDIDFDWAKIKAREIEIFLKLFDELPNDKRNEAEMTLRHIHALACKPGMDILAETALSTQKSEKWDTYFHSEMNVYSKSLAAWLYDRNVFDTAHQYLQTDSLSWWEKRLDLPRMKPKFDDDTKSALETAIQNFFREKQGRGFVCTVELRERANGTYYFFAYPDDYVQDSLSHDDNNNLVYESKRQTFEVVFAYDSAEGTSEVCAKIPKKLRGELEEIFLKHILEVVPKNEERIPYTLNMLLDPDFTLYTDPDDSVNFQVVELTLSWKKHQEEVMFVSKRTRTARERAMSSHLPFALTDAVVTYVKFRMEKRSLTGGRKRTLTFEVKTPCSCTLKNQQPDLVELAHKYLKQWRIESDTNTTKSDANCVQEAALSVG
ncbi:MAG: hypothetical protein ACRC2T_08245 [Thermoguttaceae bacterium]